MLPAPRYPQPGRKHFVADATAPTVRARAATEGNPHVTRRLILILSICATVQPPVAASARSAEGSRGDRSRPAAAPAGTYRTMDALLTPAGVSPGTESPSSAIRVQFTPTGVLSSARTITCWYNVDFPHQSTTTGLPNIHAHVDCDDYTARIVIQAYIYREDVQVGASGIRSFYGQKSVVTTANSATCVTGTFHGDEAGYIQAPPGYEPFERELYYRGPAKWVGCGGCGLASRVAVGDGTNAPLIDRRQLPGPMCFGTS